MAPGGRRNNFTGKQGTSREGQVPSLWDYFLQSLLGSLRLMQMPTAGTGRAQANPGCGAHVKERCFSLTKQLLPSSTQGFWSQKNSLAHI